MIAVRGSRYKNRRFNSAADYELGEVVSSFTLGSGVVKEIDLSRNKVYVNFHECNRGYWFSPISIFPGRWSENFRIENDGDYFTSPQEEEIGRKFGKERRKGEFAMMVKIAEIRFNETDENAYRYNCNLEEVEEGDLVLVKNWDGSFSSYGVGEVVSLKMEEDNSHRVPAFVLEKLDRANLESRNNFFLADIKAKREIFAKLEEKRITFDTMAIYRQMAMVDPDVKLLLEQLGVKVD